MKLETKEGTANERTNLHIFSKFIIKNQKKKTEIGDEKKWVKQQKKIESHDKKTCVTFQFIFEIYVYSQK